LCLDDINQAEQFPKKGASNIFDAPFNLRFQFVVGKKNFGGIE